MTVPRSLTLVLAALGLLVASAPRAHAAVCGDGIVDVGEQCDAGSANGAFISCCTVDCALRAAGETCRVATAPCDLEATADGATRECPAGGVAPDGDGDGLAAGRDGCRLS